MADVNCKGYLLRNVRKLNWFFVKEYTTPQGNNYGYILLDRHGLSLPKRFIGKRIRLKVEVIEDDEGIKNNLPTKSTFEEDEGNN